MGHCCSCEGGKGRHFGYKTTSCISSNGIFESLACYSIVFRKRALYGWGETCAASMRLPYGHIFILLSNGASRDLYFRGQAAHFKYIPAYLKDDM